MYSNLAIAPRRGAFLAQPPVPGSDWLNTERSKFLKEFTLKWVKSQIEALIYKPEFYCYTSPEFL
jgi:hypothetical protein